MIYKKINLGKDQRIFFTSDLHGYHANICRGTTNWDHGSKVRDFDTIEEMNNAIITGINSMVGENDWLVNLGDFTFGGFDKIALLRERINCKNILHILGNHDHHIAHNKEGIQSLFSGVYPYLELTVSDQGGKRSYNLFHFPITVWNKAHHDTIMLYGHVHGSYTAPNRSLDVGIDNAFKLFGEYRPFSEEDIQLYMKDRTFVQLSHHNPNTN